MLVKAKWNTKDAAGWHMTGEVFETEEDLGDSVEVLFKPETPPEPEKTEPQKEPEKAPEKPRAARRKKVSE